MPTPSTPLIGRTNAIQVLDRAAGSPRASLVSVVICGSALTREYAQALRTKRDRFVAHSGTDKLVFIVLVTTLGLDSDTYSVGIVDQVLSLEALF